MLKWPFVVLNVRVQRRNRVIWNKTGGKLFRGFHSHFTSNYRPSTQYMKSIYTALCSVNIQTLTGTQGFHAEVKKHARNPIVCVALFQRHSPALCFLITKIGRSLTLAGRMFGKPWPCLSWERLRTCSLYPRSSPLTAVLSVYRHYGECSRNEQFLHFAEAL